ncbi:MAG: TIGR03545 family protein [Elusimicrobia bacterium]|nr:TIGR03545 family protein [Elusimicrobiota bacterium]
MRWSYVIPRLVLLVLVWAFSVFAFDPLLKWGLEKGMEKGVKAKADISSLRTTFFPPSLSIKGLTLADPDKEFSNLAEFSELSFAAEGAPLLEKKLVVDEASLKGLKLGTARRTSGFLPRLARKKKEEDSAPSLASKVKDETKDMALDAAAGAKASVTADYKVDPADLESVKLAKQLEEQYKKDSADITARFSGDKYQAGLDALKARYEKAKGEKNIAKQAKDYAEIAKDLKKLTAQAAEDKKAAAEALARAKDGFKALEEARRRDQAAVMSKLKLPSLDSKSLARMLAGPAAAEKLDKAMRFIELAKKYMPAGATGALKKEAPRGRVVHFPKERAYPTLLIKKLQLTGELGTEDPLDYSGTVEGITTQPALYGKPAVAVVKGAKGARRLDFKAEVDGRGEALKTSSVLSYSGMPVKELKLGSPSSLEVDITGGTGAVEAALKTEGDNLDGKASARLSGAKFSPQGGSIKGPLKSAVESSFAGLSSAVIEAGISGTLKDPKFDVSTDLANALSRAFSSAVGAEIKKAQEEAKKKVDEAVKPYQDKLDKLAAEKQAEVDSRLKEAGDRLNGQGEKLLKDLAPGKLKLPKFKL